MPGDESALELRELILRARDGDADALGQILEHHRQQLRTVAERELAGQLGARVGASDVVQQTFLSACRRIQDFRGGTSGEFAVWLARIHERNIQDAVRRHVATRRRSVDREQPDVQGNLPDSTASSPSQRAMRLERADALEKQLAALPEDQAEAVRLRHIEGWSLDQIATHFGRSRDATASLLKRGVENLRKRIQPD
jgi:RNA polymerase sigma-70 factor, ECF subfamily